MMIHRYYAPLMPFISSLLDLTVREQDHSYISALLGSVGPRLPYLYGGWTIAARLGVIW